MPDLIERLARYTRAPMYMNAGPRKGEIERDLRGAGLHFTRDKIGNLVVSPDKPPLAVISAHMDGEFEAVPENYWIEISDGYARGVLDNSAGCAIMMEMLLKGFSKNSAYPVSFVFTVKEEKSKRRFTGAYRVCKDFIRRNYMPKLCMALDVTHPVPGGMWAYAENFTPRALQKNIGEFIERHDLKIGLRERCGEDESLVWGEHFPAFAIGPVVEGDMHGTGDVKASLESLHDTLEFLENVLHDKAFIEDTR